MTPAGSAEARRPLAVACGIAVLFLGLAALAGAARAAASGLEVAPGVYAAPAAASGGDGGRAPAGRAPDTGGRQQRIVGGRPIDISGAPWQVAVVDSANPRRGNAFERQFCGGSLVTRTLVITAAHCLFRLKVTGLVERRPQSVAVVTGRTVLSDSSQGEELLVREIILFRDGEGRPLFLGENNPWDVAALQLAESSTVGELIKLAGPGEEELWSFGRRARVSGWGATRRDGDEPSDTLLAVRQMMLEDRPCIDSFGAQFDVPTSLCAAWMSGGRASCPGDSGGPLVVPTAQGRARLVGNVQGGAAECGDRGNPFYYGRLGSDPVRAALDAVAVEFGGVGPGAIIGFGATPPLDVRLKQGRELTWSYAQRTCSRERGCRKASAGRCKRMRRGVECRSRTQHERRRGEKTCSERILWTADTGRIESDREGGRRCDRRRR
jgi:hypothetical protein